MCKSTFAACSWSQNRRRELDTGDHLGLSHQETFPSEDGGAERSQDLPGRERVMEARGEGGGNRVASGEDARGACGVSGEPCRPAGGSLSGDSDSNGAVRSFSDVGFPSPARTPPGYRKKSEFSKRKARIVPESTPTARGPSS